MHGLSQGKVCFTERGVAVAGWAIVNWNWSGRPGGYPMDRRVLLGDEQGGREHEKGNHKRLVWDSISDGRLHEAGSILRTRKAPFQNRSVPNTGNFLEDYYIIRNT
jgi:hypothetical protein